MEAVLTPAVVGFFCLLGVLLTAVRLPGTWLLLVTAVVYGWWTGWERVGTATVLILAGVALVGEAVEIFASVVTARRAGATKQAAWGALIGGFVGMLFLSFLVPIPLVGSMVGAVVGCFGGAMLTELAMRKNLARGAKGGVFAALGFAIGTATKVAIAMAMAVVLLTQAVCAPATRDRNVPSDLLVYAHQIRVEENADLVGAGYRTSILDLHPLHDRTAGCQECRGHASLLVDKALHHFVVNRRAVFASRFDGELHHVALRKPLAFHRHGPGFGAVVEPDTVVHLIHGVPG